MRRDADGTTPAARNEFNGLGDSIGYSARIVFWRFVAAVEQHMSPFDISVGQYVVLRHLWKNDGVPQHRLGVELGICEPTVAIAARKLEDLGFVHRKKNEQNRREMLVYLTQAGLDLQLRLERVSPDANIAAMKGLSSEEVSQLFRLLRKAADNLAGDR